MRRKNTMAALQELQEGSQQDRMMKEIWLPRGQCVKNNLINAWLRIGNHCELHVIMDSLRYMVTGEPQKLQNAALLHNTKGARPDQEPISHDIEVATGIDGAIMIHEGEGNIIVNRPDGVETITMQEPLYQAYLEMVCDTMGLFAPYVPQNFRDVFETTRRQFSERKGIESNNSAAGG
jgi:hypothetical protein